MKDIVLLYDGCCIYEIANTNYYLQFTGADVCFVSLEKKPVTSMEGFSLNVEKMLEEIDFSSVRSLIIPGGTVRNIRSELVQSAIKTVFERGKLVAAICAGVDLLDESGILNGLSSTHSTEQDCVADQNVITARANAYVDFGIEVAKYLNLFTSEEDLKETVAFWKYFKRMQ